MAEPVIRRATSEDLSALAWLRCEFTLEDGPIASPREDFDSAFLEIVGSGLKGGGWVVWVADVNSEIVSHAFVGLVDKIPRPTAGHRWLGYLTNVYTVRGHRNRGLGGRVLEATKEWAREEDVELLVVWPSEESVSFYHRHGFAGDEEPLVWTSGTASD